MGCNVPIDLTAIFVWGHTASSRSQGLRQISFLHFWFPSLAGLVVDLPLDIVGCRSASHQPTLGCSVPIISVLVLHRFVGELKRVGGYCRVAYQSAMLHIGGALSTMACCHGPHGFSLARRMEKIPFHIWLGLPHLLKDDTPLLLVEY